MSAARIAAIILIVAGVLALAYGGFTYTRETREANIGPVEVTVKDKETVNVPIWAGAGAVGVGVILLLTSRKR